MTDTQTEFLSRDVRALGRRVHRIGVSATHGLDASGVRAAFDRGLNYVFWNSTARAITKALQELPQDQRDRLLLATGPSIAVTAGSLRRRVERVLRLLKRDQLDVLQLYWLGRMSAWRPAVVEEMVRLRDEGKVRALGVSIHDRPRAGALAEDSPLDLLMIRYNAAHPGAERDIFPHLTKRNPAVIAYTATS